MPPPKARLHKNTGKSRTGPTQTSNNSEPLPSTSDPTANLTPEQEQQFQTELYWCIEQLQIALSSNKLNNKQIQDHTKSLNTLMSNTAPMIKKRQVMRLSFGNYREKMTNEERKVKKITMTVSPAKPNQKSVFIKKAIITPSQNNFKFDFQNAEDEPNSTNEEMVPSSVSEMDNKNTAFVRSDNTFRFNFTNDDNCDK